MRQELAIIPKQLPIELPHLPPRPVWDEHIEAYLERTKNFTCQSKTDFDAGKELAKDGTGLRALMLQSYAPLTQAIDAIKEPVLKQRNEDVLQIDNAIKLIDSINISWKREQDRIAQEEAERKRQEEIRRREEARQAEIKRLEGERQEKLRQLEAERETERLRLEAQQQKDAETAEVWGEEVALAPIDLPPVELAPVSVAEIIPPRHVTVDSGLSYRKGARVKPKMVVAVTDPDAVNRVYCSPDKIKYEAAAKSYFALLRDPTLEQVKKIEDQIGGVTISWE